MSRPKISAWIALSLFAVTLILYAPVVRFEFIRYDDPGYVVLNPRVSTGLSWSNVGWALTAFEVGNWHPLTLISHMTDVSIFGMHPGAHHAVNATLHAANAALLFLFWNLATGRPWPSLLAAGLFAVHPLNVESVAWVAQRKSVLCMLFVIASLLAYAGWTRHAGPTRYALALGFFVAALMSKPMAVSMPALLLLLDVWPFARMAPVRRLLLEKVPFTVVAVAASVVAWEAQRSGGALGTFRDYPIGVRAADAVFAGGWYVFRMLWPRNLSLFYPTTLGPHAAIEVAGSLLLMAAVTALVALLGRSRRYLVLGWGWYLAALAPVLGLVQFGTQIVADRYAYLALIGPFAAIAFGVSDIVADWTERTRRLTGALGAASFVALALATGTALAPWRDSVSVLSRGYERAPDNVHALTNLGLELVELNRFEEGITLLSKAARSIPLYSTVHVNLGYAYAKTGRLQDARAEYEIALPMRPDDAKLAMELGRVLVQLGERNDAETWLRESLARDPGLVQAWLFLGTLFYAEGRYAEGEPVFERAAELAPGDARALTALGVNLAALGRRDEAIAVLRKATALDPGFARARTELQTLIGSGDPP